MHVFSWIHIKYVSSILRNNIGCFTYIYIDICTVEPPLYELIGRRKYSYDRIFHIIELPTFRLFTIYNTYY